MFTAHVKDNIYAIEVEGNGTSAAFSSLTDDSGNGEI